WRQLFEAAGLDLDQFQAAVPEWNSLAAADARAAWTGTYPGRPDLPLRVEAGAYRGRPVFFKLIGEAWAKPERDPPPGVSWAIWLIVGVMAVGGALAARNLRLGRGDRRGAWRLAVAFFTVEMIGWLGTGNLS